MTDDLDGRCVVITGAVGGIGTAMVEEGIELRRGGVKAPIIVLGAAMYPVRLGFYAAAYPALGPDALVAPEQTVVLDEDRSFESRELVAKLTASDYFSVVGDVGSLAEMTEGDIYDVVDQYSRQNRLGYVHLRNVRDKVPHYKETFIDDGEVDVLRVRGRLVVVGAEDAHLARVDQ